MIKELVEHIVRTIVDKPEAVTVTMTKADELTTFEISVDPADRGKVIGREGHTIKTIRSLIGILVPPGNGKVTVDIVNQ